MTPQEMLVLVRRRPFQPFRIYLTDQTHYDIHHPEMLMVGTRTAVVGTTENPNQKWYDIPITISLLDIVRVEPLQPAAAN
jgi:hypothetical protein